MKNETLSLDLGPRSYPIDFGPGLIDTIGQRMKALNLRGQTAVVTNDTVAPLFLDRVRTALEGAGYSVLPILLPDGEVHKNFATLQQIFDALLTHRMERSTILIALGGGVIGDMTGFAASAFLRGVTFVQIPTTLLAQVDSSVGGKTGINHPLGKNMIGAFYQPRLVTCDLETLSTLPKREFLAGMAEVIKYGLIRDADFFRFLSEHLDAILDLKTGPLQKVVQTCCAIKAEVVSADEHERGQRALLNFGHTFGHAIESLTGYDQLLHGEAVAMGMVMAADLSRRMGWLGEEQWRATVSLLRRTGLPLTVPELEVAAFKDAFSRDKKVRDGRPRFVLLREIGHATVTSDIPEPLLSDLLRDHAQHRTIQGL
ncbi:MAG: 3-dehydroquinate synthase [Magnetococcales bacterium]|nr:3-dehydroquinate synthase [Magnetococcales bacterium]MBF0151349.1 3-dehydroquinate synthase [Magnetococcales bacterium]MBF0172982.1 3-dehydroquinate synthase [Magnetococcales bacterium]MBF0348280.1 3-dehydroquinate synthase [Magnetococcales bacterium]MBF0631947.1 3-dehydroquinate synthase [Magnetococcales bacterium]